MRGDEGVHEGFEVWAPPLREGVADFPFVVDAFARELGPDGGEAFVEAVAEAFELGFVGLEVVAWARFGERGGVRVSSGNAGGGLA